MSGMSDGAMATDGSARVNTWRATRTNWSGNYTYSTDRLLEPAALADVQAAVRATSQMRALGSRHSFNGIADSMVAQISLRQLNWMELNAADKTVTIGGGVRYGELAPWLHERGFALHNLASLPHITVVGACATATHGSGVCNGNLSTAICALQFVDGRGDVVELSRAQDAERFAGAVVNLGALGLVTRVTLQIEPTFEMRQVVYLDLPFAELEQNFDAIFGAGYSVSLFTDWQNAKATQVWIKSRVEPNELFAIAPEFFTARAATRKMHPLLDHAAEFTTDQLGVPGPWYERMPHFLMRFSPSSGEELQTEYFVPRAHAVDAIRAVETLRDEITPLLFVSELRRIAADDLWMSPCYQQDSLALHFTWKPVWPQVRRVLPLIEAKLAPFGVKPHWGKLFTMSPVSIQTGYARLKDFRNLLEEADPGGRFRNDFIQTNLFG